VKDCHKHTSRHMDQVAVKRWGMQGARREMELLHVKYRGQFYLLSLQLQRKGKKV